MLSQFALLILGFFSQRAMNLYMGAELVGMNGVISNVINILSVTELGISTASFTICMARLQERMRQRLHR